MTQDSTAHFEIQYRDGAATPVAIDARAVWIHRDAAGRVVFSAVDRSGASARIEIRSGRFSLIVLELDSLIFLNGRPVDDQVAETLVAGDLVRWGDTELALEQMDEKGAQIRIAINSFAGADAIPEPREAETGQEVTGGDNAAGSSDAMEEFWKKRTRDKIAQPSPLHPREPPRPGKARFSWGPTRDLARPWPVAVFAWAAIVVLLACVAASLLYARAFSPGELSNPHARPSREQAGAITAIAARPNANSCTSCHALTKSMDSQCAACHQTEAFSSATTGIDAHARAGIGCVTCHTEHRGAGFAAINAAVATCAKCHRDGNIFNGRPMSTPHGGVPGYPVANGKWTWKGLAAEELAAKPDAASPGLQAAAQRLPNETDDQWRSRQFHAVHLNRIHLGNSGLAGDARGLLSCSSCHRSLNPIDNVTPATTCVKCHNGDNGAFDRTGQPVLPPTAANCVSCHVQHAKQPYRWNPTLLNPQS